MKKSRFTEEQIALALRQAEAGTKATEVCRKMGVRRLYILQLEEEVRCGAGLGVSELRRW